MTRKRDKGCVYRGNEEERMEEESRSGWHLFQCCIDHDSFGVKAFV